MKNNLLTVTYTQLQTCLHTHHIYHGIIFIMYLIYCLFYSRQFHKRVPIRLTKRSPSLHSLPRTPLGCRAGLRVSTLHVQQGWALRRPTDAWKVHNTSRGSEGHEQSHCEEGVFSTEGSREVPEATEGRSGLEAGTLRNIWGDSVLV